LLLSTAMSLFRPVDLGQRALDYHLQRHNVLASNVANVDTPGFRPMELVRESGRDRLDPGGPRVRLERTRSAHLRLPNERAGETGAGIERVVQPGGDHNAVSLEREMAKVAANDLRFSAVGRFVRQHLGMLRYAASDTQG